METTQLENDKKRWNKNKNLNNKNMNWTSTIWMYCWTNPTSLALGSLWKQGLQLSYVESKVKQ